MSTDPDHTHRQRLTKILGTTLFAIPLIYIPAGGGFLPIKRVLMYVGVLLAILTWLRSSKSEVWASLPVTRYAALYVSLACISAFWAIDPFISLVAATQYVGLLILFTIGASLLEPEDVPTLSRYLAGSGLIVGSIGIFEFYGADIVLLRLLGLSDFRIPSAGRPSATFGFRNLAASFLIGGLPFAWLAWKTESRPIHRRLWLTAIFVMALFLVYTRTRGAWAGIFVGSIVALCYQISQGQDPFAKLASNPLRSLAVVAMFCALSLAEPQLTNPGPQTFDTTKASTTEALSSMVSPEADRGRLTFWRNTMKMVAKNPILGVGFDNWELAYPLYDLGEWSSARAEPVRPHNDILWVWSELGPLGLVAFLGLVGLPIYRAFKRQPSDDVSRNTTGVCLASLVALFVHGGFSFLREQPVPALLLWVSILGLSLPDRRQRKFEYGRAARLAAPTLGCLAILVGVAHARFDIGYATAMTYYNQDRLRQALTEVRHALRNGVFDHRATFVEARILQSLGQREAAVDAYRSALERHPNYANTHHNLGGVLASLGDLNGALAHYKRALEIRPNYHEARLNAANALVKAGQLQAAKQEALRVTREDKGRPGAFALLGAIRLHEGDLEYGILDLERAVKLDPEKVEAYNNLAFAYEKSGRQSEAVAAYREVVRLWTGDPDYLNTVRAKINSLVSVDQE